MIVSVEPERIRAARINRYQQYIGVVDAQVIFELHHKPVKQMDR